MKIKNTALMRGPADRKIKNESNERKWRNEVEGEEI